MMMLLMMMVTMNMMMIMMTLNLHDANHDDTDAYNDEDPTLAPKP